MKKMLFFSIAFGLLCSAGGFGINPAIAGDDEKFKVTITNLTRGQSFTPILVASHKKGVKLFKLGMPASLELEMLAEGGATGPLRDLLLGNELVKDVKTSGGLLGPGESVSVSVESSGAYKYISIASMLLPTNDGFFSLNGIKGPEGKKTRVLFSPAYDAGTEENNEMCPFIPGPQCGGLGLSAPAPTDEGYVHVHAGIHGMSVIPPDLDPSMRDWRNPVAKITIQRVK